MGRFLWFAVNNMLSKERTDHHYDSDINTNANVYGAVTCHCHCESSFGAVHVAQAPVCRPLDQAHWLQPQNHQKLAAIILCPPLPSAQKLILIYHPTEGRRLSRPGGLLHTKMVYLLADSQSSRY